MYTKSTLYHIKMSKTQTISYKKYTNYKLYPIKILYKNKIQYIKKIYKRIRYYIMIERLLVV